MNTTKITKMGTVAVVLAASETPASPPSWVETISDEREIELLEGAIAAGEPFPLQKVYEFRSRAQKEDDEFGDYVEDLLSQRFVRPEIQAHGVAWLKSKVKIDQFRSQERDAAEVIAHFALGKFKEDPALTDFVLAGPGVQVRIRIFRVPCAPGSFGAAA